MSGRKIKLGVAAGVAGLSLLTGGLLFGSTLVSAQEPTPQATEEPATPQTPQDGEHDKGDCPNMQNGQQGDQSGAEGSSTGARFRGMHRGFAQ